MYELNITKRELTILDKNIKFNNIVYDNNLLYSQIPDILWYINNNKERRSIKYIPEIPKSDYRAKYLKYKEKYIKLKNKNNK
jgi:hypothetical protein